MAPPTWLGLAAATGNRRYRDFALAEFWAASDFLYDPAERLYFRDSRFFDQGDEQGPSSNKLPSKWHLWT